MKFLVMWELDIAHLRIEVVHAVMRMPDYAAKLTAQGKLEKMCRSVLLPRSTGPRTIGRN